MTQQQNNPISDAKSKYEREKRAHRGVSFNRVTEQDLLAFVDSVNFSQWVKAKIREELNQAA